MQVSKRIWAITTGALLLAAGSVLMPATRGLVDCGVLRDMGESEYMGKARRAFDGDPSWRAWLSVHATLLPDPSDEIPA